MVEKEDALLAYEVLNQGINVNSCMYRGTPILSLAIQKGCAPIVEDLLVREADVNLKDWTGKTPLYYLINPQQGAKSINQKWFLKRFIEAGAELGNVDGKGLSALSLAVKTKQPKIVDALLKSGQLLDYAYIHYKDNLILDSFRPLLHYTIRVGDKEMFTHLVEKGASLEQKNRNGQTPFEFALSLGKGDFLNLKKITTQKPVKKGNFARQNGD